MVSTTRYALNVFHELNNHPLAYISTQDLPKQFWDMKMKFFIPPGVKAKIHDDLTLLALLESHKQGSDAFYADWRCESVYK